MRRPYNPVERFCPLVIHPHLGANRVLPGQKSEETFLKHNQVADYQWQNTYLILLSFTHLGCGALGAGADEESLRSVIEG